MVVLDAGLQFLLPLELQDIVAHEKRIGDLGVGLQSLHGLPDGNHGSIVLAQEGQEDVCFLDFEQLELMQCPFPLLFRHVSDFVNPDFAADKLNDEAEPLFLFLQSVDLGHLIFFFVFLVFLLKLALQSFLGRIGNLFASEVTG